MNEQMIIQLATDVNNVVKAAVEPLQAENKRLQQQVKDAMQYDGQIEAENKRLRKALEKTTNYLTIRTKSQRKYSTARYVDKLIEENRKALKGKK